MHITEKGLKPYPRAVTPREGAVTADSRLKCRIHHPAGFQRLNIFSDIFYFVSFSWPLSVTTGSNPGLAKYNVSSQAQESFKLQRITSYPSDQQYGFPGPNGSRKSIPTHCLSNKWWQKKPKHLSHLVIVATSFLWLWILFAC